MIPEEITINNEALQLKVRERDRERDTERQKEIKRQGERGKERERERERDRERDKETERERVRERETKRQTERERKGKRGKEKRETETDRETETERKIETETERDREIETERERLTISIIRLMCIMSVLFKRQLSTAVLWSWTKNNTKGKLHSLLNCRKFHTDLHHVLALLMRYMKWFIFHIKLRVSFSSNC